METGFDERPVRRRFWLPRLSRYVLGQLVAPIGLLTVLMTGVIWLIQFPHLLDLVINRGQSAPTFLYMTVLLIPTLVVIILPIAFFFGTLLALSRLNGDSELVVMASAGYSQRQLAVPLFIAAGVVMAITWLCALWLMPLGQRALAAKEMDIRADVAGALLKEGEFNPAAPGLTVFIRQIGHDGQFDGILVHDSRNPKRPVTYIAKHGVLAQTPDGARLVMDNGTIEQTSDGGAHLSILTFKSDAIDLDQFAGPTHATLRKTNERSLSELFDPPETQGVTARIRNTWLAEAHNRLSQPLYCIAFGLIAMATILRERRQRGALAKRTTLASLSAIGLRIAGYGVSGLAARHPALAVLFYAIPLLGAAGALAVMMGYWPGAAAAARTAEAAA